MNIKSCQSNLRTLLDNLGNFMKLQKMQFEVGYIKVVTKRGKNLSCVFCPCMVHPTGRSLKWNLFEERFTIDWFLLFIGTIVEIQ